MLSRAQVIDASFLDLRLYILEIAATLDRFDRAAASGGEEHDPRWLQIKQALQILSKERPQPDRTEELLMLFSDLSQEES